MLLEKWILRLTAQQPCKNLKLHCNGEGAGRGRKQRESSEESSDKKLSVEQDWYHIGTAPPSYDKTGSLGHLLQTALTAQTPSQRDQDRGPLRYTLGLHFFTIAKYLLRFKHPPYPLMTTIYLTPLAISRHPLETGSK